MHTCPAEVVNLTFYGLLSLCRSLAFVSVTTRGTLPQNDTRFFRKKRFILWNALLGWSKSVCVSFFNSVAGGLNWATLNLKLVFSCSYYWVNICAKDPKKQHVTTTRQITSNTFDTYDVGAGYATDMPFVLHSCMFTWSLDVLCVPVVSFEAPGHCDPCIGVKNDWGPDFPASIVNRKHNAWLA